MNPDRANQNSVKMRTYRKSDDGGGTCDDETRVGEEQMTLNVIVRLIALPPPARHTVNTQELGNHV